MLAKGLVNFLLCSIVDSEIYGPLSIQLHNTNIPTGLDFVEKNIHPTW